MYHSIHARGERVEDVIKEMELSGVGVLPHYSTLPGESNTAEVNGVVAEDLEDGELAEELEVTGPDDSGNLRGTTQASDPARG